jgi:hypothetical protein
VDLPLGTNDNVFVRYINTRRTRFVPGFLGGVLDGTSTSAWGRNFLNSQSTVAGWTKVLGPTLVNEFRFSWARGRSDGQQDPFGQNGLDQIGFKGVPADPAILGGIVGIDISAHVRLGSPNFMPKVQHTDQVEYLNTLSWLHGRHAFKFGADIMTPMNNQYLDVPSTRGNLGFNGQFTGSALGDFLLGYARSAELSNVFIINQRHYATNFFAQDDWKATSRLTVNLGLRYDFMTPAYERDNHMANFDPVAGALVFASDGSLENRALVKPDRNNFAPRVGLVYKLSDTLVARGGYGVFYNPFDRIGSEDQIALNPPGLRNISITAASSATTPVLFLRRVPGELSRPRQHRPEQVADSRCRSECARCAFPAVRRRHRAPDWARLLGLGRRHRQHRQEHRNPQKHQPATTRFARCQRSAAVSEFRQRPVARHGG